jgi:hypothetical protein
MAALIFDSMFPDAPRPWTIECVTKRTDRRTKRSEYVAGYRLNDANGEAVAMFYDRQDAVRVVALVNAACGPCECADPECPVHPGREGCDAAADAIDADDVGMCHACRKGGE